MKLQLWNSIKIMLLIFLITGVAFSQTTVTIPATTWQGIQTFGTAGYYNCSQTNGSSIVDLSDYTTYNFYNARYLFNHSTFTNSKIQKVVLQVKTVKVYNGIIEPAAASLGMINASTCTYPWNAFTSSDLEGIYNCIYSSSGNLNVINSISTPNDGSESTINYVIHDPTIGIDNSALWDASGTSLVLSLNPLQDEITIEAISLIITYQANAITNNVITAPSVTSFAGSGDPGNITGSTPAGGNGSFTYQWQTSPNGTTWTNITTSGTSISYDPLPISQTTYYRRVVSSSGVPSVNSNNVIIYIIGPITNNVLTPPSITTYTGSADPSNIIGSTPSGGDGTYTYQWKSSPDGITWANIPGATGKNYDPVPINQTTYYQRIVSSSIVSPNVSSSVIITILPAIGNNTICCDQAFNNFGDPDVLTGLPPTGGTNTYTYQWQSSPDNTTWTNIPSATLSSYDPSNLLQTTYYRRVVSSGPGASSYSLPVTVTITVLPITNNCICCNQTLFVSGVPSNFTGPALGGGNGNFTIQWQSSADGTTWNSITGANGTSYQPGSISQTTYYKRYVTCGTATSSSVSIVTVNPISTGNNTWSVKTAFGTSGVQSIVGFGIGNKGYLTSGTNTTYNLSLNEWDGSSWTLKNPFPGTGRINAVAFSINNKGYVGLGITTSSLQNDFWEWDQSSNTWTQKANFSGTARQASVGFSIGSKGYIGTGQDINGNTNDFYEYDPCANRWTAKTSFSGTARKGATGFSIGNKGYLGTGYGTTELKDFWEFDPNDITHGYDSWGVPMGSWNQKADFAGTQRWYASSFSIGNKGYIGTGMNLGVLLNDFWEYDPNLGIPFGTWIRKTDYPTFAKCQAAGFSIGNKGYIAGGYGLSNRYFSDVVEYSPSEISTLPLPSSSFCYLSSFNVSFSTLHTYNSGNVFTAQLSDANGSFANPFTLGTLSGTTSGTIPVTIPADGSVSSGVGFRIRVISSNPVITGTDNGSDFSIGITQTSFNDVYITDKPFALTGGLPAGGTYSGPGVSGNTFDPASAGVGSFTIVYTFITGYGCQASIGKNINVLPCNGSGTWTQRHDLGTTTALQRAASFAFSIGNKGYMGGGQDQSGTFKSDFWQYDPRTNAWTQMADFGGGVRTQAFSFSIGTKGYAGTGYYGPNAGATTNDFWEYDQVYNRWTAKSNFAGVARAAATGLSIGTKGYVGGGNSTEFWEFDPTDLSAGLDVWGNPKGKWNLRTPIPGVARGGAVGLTINGKGYFGLGFGSVFCNDIYEYDPNINSPSGTWAAKASLPGAGRNLSTGFVQGAKVYIAGGFGSGSTYYKELWEFDPSGTTGTWTQKTSYTGQGVYGALGFSIGNTSFVGTGNTGTGSVASDFWEYCKCSPQLYTGNIAQINYNGQDQMAVPFTFTGVINQGNTFTAQLSNASGNFSNPIIIGTLSGNAGGTLPGGVGQGTINAIVPTNVISGIGYRVRVIASDPAFIGYDNGTNITISNGGALNFAAANNQKVTIPLNSAYNLGTGDFTLEAYVNMSSTQTSSTPSILSNRTSGTNGFLLSTTTGGTKLSIQLAGVNYTSQSFISILDNTCHHIAVSRSAGLLKFYVDGNPRGSATSMNSLNGGSLLIGNDVLLQPFNGTISYVRIWNTAKTLGDITANMQLNSIAPGTPNLIGYWDLDYAGSQTVFDQSITANNGVQGSTSSVETSDPSWSISKCFSQSEAGLLFNSQVTNKAVIPYDPVFDIGTGDFTIESWVALNTTQSFQTPPILSKRNSGVAQGGFLLAIYPSSSIVIQIDAVNFIGGTSANVLDNKCHHIAVTRTGGLVRIFVDGVFGGGGSNNGPINLVSDLKIGYDPIDGSTVNGLINEVRFWNIARSQSDLQMYINGVAPNSSGLIGYWKFNETTGQTIKDALISPNVPHNGYLGSSPQIDAQDPARSQSICFSADRLAASLPTVIDSSISNVEIYPNPFNSDFNIVIKSDSKEKSNVRIFDLNGKTVYENQVNKNEVLQVGGDFPAGMYFVEISDLLIGRKTYKVVKIN